MATWGDFLGDLRTDIDDTGTDPKWPDATLFLWFKDAVRDYNKYFKQVKSRSNIAVSSNAGEFALPSDFVEIIFVESPIDTYLERRAPRPGVKYRSNNYTYHIVDSTLYAPSHLDEIWITYKANHTLPTDESDTTHVLTISEDDFEMLRIYIKAKLVDMDRTKTARLDRHKPTGKRDDNPLIPESVLLMSRYDELVSERLGGGAVFLHRKGRSK